MDNNSTIEVVRCRLLEANNLDLSFFNTKSKQLLKSRVDYCDFYLQSSLSEAWSLDEGLIKNGSFAIDQGIGVRAISGAKTFLSYSNSLTPTTISALVDNLFVEPSTSKSKIDTRALTSEMTDKNVTSLYVAQNPILSATSEYKIGLLKHINEVGRALDLVTNVIASLSLNYDEVYLARSDDREHADIRPLIHISMTIIINKNGKMETGRSGFGGRYLLDQVTPSVLDSHVMLAYDQALLKLEAAPGPSGKLPVVLGNGWAGVILHEAVGHGLEGDFNRRGSSAFSGKIGTQVASQGVTVIDEGCIANRRGSLNMDDEGNPTQKNVLIEDGILKGYLFDELNARLMGTKSTGNGRRESFASSPMPRMTNTYMLGGKYTHDEIIASVKDGLYADNFEGGQVDITSGQFVFNASTAWVIKDGKLAYPVKGCALVGNGPECLKYVSMIGNDLVLDDGIGTCGKDGQSVPVGVGQPTIRVDDGLVIGGA